MTRRCCVEHHERAARFQDNSREGVEHSDLFGAGRTQILAQKLQTLRVEIAAAILHYFLDIAFGLRLGVNSIDAQSGNLTRERHSQMGRWISRAEMYGMTALNQTEGDGGSDGGLANAAFTHDHY